MGSPVVLLEPPRQSEPAGAPPPHPVDLAAGQRELASQPAGSKYHGSAEGLGWKGGGGEVRTVVLSHPPPGSWAATLVPCGGTHWPGKLFQNGGALGFFPDPLLPKGVGKRLTLDLALVEPSTVEGELPGEAVGAQGADLFRPTAAVSISWGKSERGVACEGGRSR